MLHILILEAHIPLLLNTESPMNLFFKVSCFKKCYTTPQNHCMLFYLKEHIMVYPSEHSFYTPTMEKY